VRAPETVADSEETAGIIGAAPDRQPIARAIEEYQVPPNERGGLLARWRATGGGFSLCQPTESSRLAAQSTMPLLATIFTEQVQTPRWRLLDRRLPGTRRKGD
jgi:hypothetical protein